jgi:hypothetical protein
VVRDFWEYALQREAECKTLSLSPTDLSYFAEAESDDMRGLVWGAVDLDERAFLDVREVVVVEDGTAHREEYGYFLVVDEVEIWGYERDPSHDPACHSHGRGHQRYAAPSISFKDVVEEAWETLTKIYELGLEEDFDPMAEMYERIG